MCVRPIALSDAHEHRQVSRTNGWQESFLAHPFTNFQRHADPIIFWRGRFQLEAEIFEVSTAFRREIVELRRNLQGGGRTSM